MVLSVASRSGGRDIATTVFDFGVLVADRFGKVAHAGFDERPGALVLGLFLGPKDVGVLVSLKVALGTSEWEWSKLLDSDDRHVVCAAFRALSFEVVVDLTTAEHNSSDLVV